MREKYTFVAAVATLLPTPGNAVHQWQIIMKKVPSAESLAQLMDFEQFLVNNKKKLMLASFLVAFVITIVFMPPSGPIPQGPESKEMQTTRSINLLLFSYANDHNQKYPVGKSSTDIFQQLIDQQYCTDPTIFYFPMPGKTPATTNKLKPENVCFDVTNGVLPDDSDDLPIVVSTGFKIDYVPNGKAHLLANGDTHGIAVAFKSNSAMFKLPTPNGIVLIAPSFDPKGRTYQQLTPEGPLP